MVSKGADLWWVLRGAASRRDGKALALPFLHRWRSTRLGISGSVFEFHLLGTGEPHGTIGFTEAFDTVSRRSLSNEFWNGFTVGVQVTAREVFTTPEPASIALFGLGMTALLGIRRRAKENA